ncbi:DUF3021 domain-containing protein [Streptococcus dentiloxodontae]
MNILRKMVSSAFIGIGIGYFITFFVTLLAYRTYKTAIPSFAEQFSTETQAVASQLFVFALLGIGQGLAAFLFKTVKDKQGFLLIVCLHYILIAFPLLAAAWYLHWVSMTWFSFLAMLIVISMVYVLVFIVNYLSVRKDIIQINAKLH